MVSFRWKWLLLAFLPALAWGGPPLRFASSSIYLPLTLPSLVQGSERIFVGRVEAIQKVGSDKDRLVSFKVEMTLKGIPLVPATLTVRQTSAMSAALKVGEKVIWFLPADSPHGYS